MHVYVGKELLPWLPDPTPESDNAEEYLPFADVICVETTEKYCPSLLSQTALDEDSAADAQNRQLLVSTKVHTTVTCTGCDKPCCVYSRHVMTSEEIAYVRDIAEDNFISVVVHY